MDQGHVSFEDIRFKCSFVVTFKFSFFFVQNRYLSQKNICCNILQTSRYLNICDRSTKAVLSRWGIFIVIAKNTLYGSKLYIFLLCQKSFGY